jgi:hypothetical protein
VYGGRIAFRLVVAMLVAMVVASLVVDGIFAVAGLVPPRPEVATVVEKPVGWNVTSVLDVVGLVVSGGLLLLARRSGHAAHCAHHHAAHDH